MKFSWPWSRVDLVEISKPPAAKKDEPAPEQAQKKEEFFKIHIMCKNRTIAYKNGPITDKYNKRPFLDFERWFFGRPQSKYFVFMYDKGKELIPREEIVYWKIFREEE